MPCIFLVENIPRVVRQSPRLNKKVLQSGGDIAQGTGSFYGGKASGSRSASGKTAELPDRDNSKSATPSTSATKETVVVEVHAPGKYNRRVP